MNKYFGLVEKGSFLCGCCSLNKHVIMHLKA